MNLAKVTQRIKWAGNLASELANQREQWESEIASAKNFSSRAQILEENIRQYNASGDLVQARRDERELELDRLESKIAIRKRDEIEQHRRDLLEVLCNLDEWIQVNHENVDIARSTRPTIGGEFEDFKAHCVDLRRRVTNGRR